MIENNGNICSGMTYLSEEVDFWNIRLLEKMV